MVLNLLAESYKWYTQMQPLVEVAVSTVNETNTQKTI